jgi:hypothetical protein
MFFIYGVCTLLYALDEVSKKIATATKATFSALSFSYFYPFSVM